MRSWLVPTIAGGFVLLTLFAQPRAALQQRPPASADADWPMYRHDYAGTGASPLKQIDAGNVTRLRQPTQLVGHLERLHPDDLRDLTSAHAALEFAKGAQDGGRVG